MVKRIKKDKHEDEYSRRNFYISIFILVIMVSSIVGFAMMSSRDVSSDPNSLPSEIEFQEFNQDGQIFWGAIKNHEQFIFLDIEGFDKREDMASLASQIKTKKEVKVYVDSDFESSDAIFMIEKVLRGLKISQSRTLDNNCDENTLVLTNNISFNGTCMKFISNKGEEYQNSNILVYYLVK